MEPPEKRSKLNDSIIRSNLADEFIELPTTRQYYAGKIDDKRLTSRVMKELNEKIEIECMDNVKRVNVDLEVLICPVESVEVSDDSEQERLRAFMSLKKVSDEIVCSITNRIKVVDIPDSRPMLRWQFEALKESWPCKFHENKYLESLYANTMFSDSELRCHQKFMKICKYLSQELDSVDVGLAVNPYNARIVAFGCAKTAQNPIQHTTMDLIDQVAITQDGGAWSTKHSDEYHQLTKNTSTLFNVNFGEAAFPLSTNSDDNLQKFGPYLCTGYSIYLLNEPCLMCAMALIHSRARRVFYHRPSRADGCLGSSIKLHTNRNLNHRFEAFHLMALT